MAKQRWWSRRSTPEPAASNPAPDLPPDAPADPPVVLGAQMAAASAAEDQHQAVDHGPSPLAGTSYRTADHDLFRLTTSPVDEVIGALADRFAAADASERAELTARLTQDDLYDVIAFARRSALAARRAVDPAIAERGVRATAMVAIERVDWRDLLWADQLLAYVLQRLGADGADVFSRAAALATGDTAKALAGLAGAEADDLGAYGYEEIETDEGVGFIGSMGEDYEPDRDLVSVALAVAAGLGEDPWRLRSPEIGHSIAAVWFQGRPEEEVRRALDEVTGCATVDGQLQAGDPTTAMQQQLLVFVIETSTPAAAGLLAAAAGTGEPTWFAWTSAVRDRVCAVAISRSVVKDGAAFESAGSIQRFAPVFERALAAGA